MRRGRRYIQKKGKRGRELGIRKDVSRGFFGKWRVRETRRGWFEGSRVALDNKNRTRKGMSHKAEEEEEREPCVVVWNDRKATNHMLVWRGMQSIRVSLHLSITPSLSLPRKESECRTDDDSYYECWCCEGKREGDFRLSLSIYVSVLCRYIRIPPLDRRRRPSIFRYYLLLLPFPGNNTAVRSAGYRVSCQIPSSSSNVCLVCASVSWAKEKVSFFPETGHAELEGESPVTYRIDAMLEDTLINWRVAGCLLVKDMMECSQPSVSTGPEFREAEGEGGIHAG